MPETGAQLTGQVLIRQIGLGKDDDRSRSQAAALVRRLRAQGRLVLLFDALDQASGDGTAVKLLRNLTHDPEWDRCRIVLSTRPHALQRYWVELFSDDSIGWRYVQLDEFTEEQQRLFLGETEAGQDRLDLIPEEAREVLSVPRVLEYLRSLPDGELAAIRTASDVYWRAIQYMVNWGMYNSAEARRLGILPEQPRLFSRLFGFISTLTSALASLLRRLVVCPPVCCVAGRATTIQEGRDPRTVGSAGE
jgi:hypothetical protein